MSKCPSKSPSRRGVDKRKDAYDSRNQMIMVAGPTGKRKYDKAERNSYSPTESFHKIGKQLAMTNQILNRGLKDQTINRFLVQNNEGITPALFQIDNISNTLSNIPVDPNESNLTLNKIDKGKRFSSPNQSKPEQQKRFDLVYQNDCDSRMTSEKRSKFMTDKSFEIENVDRVMPIK